MFQTITVVYEDGVLKPLQKVDFKEHQRFKVNITTRREINITPEFTQQIDSFIKKYRSALEELAKR